MRPVVLALLGLALTATAAAQSCPQPPGEPTGAPWPDAVEVPSVVVGDPSIGLTRAEGEAIRCAVQRRLRRAVRDVPSDLRAQVRNRRVGWLWMDGDRPRIGSFFLQRDTDGTLELSDTLAMSARVRIGLVVRLEKRASRWRVTSVGIRTDHHR